MHILRGLCIGALVLLMGAGPVAAQHWGEVTGHVVDDADGEPLPGVTVLVEETDYGTATDADGAYALRLPEGEHTLRFSLVGYEREATTVTVDRDAATTRDVTLSPTVLELEGVTVEDEGVRDAGVYEVDPEDIHSMPTPFKDGFRALKAMPGVATNNELTQQYSVRGGGYNENLIFIDGFEVHMPFRPRQGEQEGLGLLNPNLTESITFYTGGFPAEHGGKLSSALEVDYERPDDVPLHGSASASTLDASLHAGSSAFDNRVGWTVGVRKAQAGRFFGTQDLQGDYNPDFTDVQGKVAVDLADGHELEALGIWADHSFELDPENQRTYFGAISQDPDAGLQAMWTDFEGAQRDGYTTQFGGLRLTNTLPANLEAEHSLAYFGTEEREQFDIRGNTELFEIFLGADDPTSEAGRFGIGEADQVDRADNRVAVSTLTGSGAYQLRRDRHAPKLGWEVRGLHFDDRINEKSIINARLDDQTQGTERIVADSLVDSASLTTTQASVYAQDVIDVLPERDRLLLTAGVRADYYEFNDEWTVSPRLSASYQHSDQLSFTGSWGLYHQKPTYRELRGKPDPGESILDALNRDLQAQRSMQFVAGGEYFFPDRRLYLRAEAYYKDLQNLISYDIENIRVQYSGENDARGYAYGLDVQLRGELVPGLESWFNYSYLMTRERFLPEFQTRWNEGLIPRPSDQRHTFSAFVQDYVPGDDTWRLHMRALYGSGLPYTPPVPEETQNGTVQVPGPRSNDRLPPYRRVDMGATKEIEVVENGIANPVQLDLTIELLNVFDMTNTVAYTWIPDGQNEWTRVPQRLTPRTLNVRARLQF